METVTIRELRRNWIAVEKHLNAVGELSVTRYSTPVAVLRLPRPPAGAGQGKASPNKSDGL
jgi:hypothetical protein